MLTTPGSNFCDGCAAEGRKSYDIRSVKLYDVRADVNTAGELHADLIVIGTHGRRGVQRMLL